MTITFARGKLARGECDRCGRGDLLLDELKFQVVNQRPTNLRVCPDCLDVDHPQLLLGKVPVNDPQALWQPRIDIDREVSRQLGAFGPVASNLPPMTSAVGIITPKVS